MSDDDTIRAEVYKRETDKAKEDVSASRRRFDAQRRAGWGALTPEEGETTRAWRAKKK